MQNEILVKPLARPHKPAPTRLKIDQKSSWNARFFIEKMPEYDALKDKHLQNFIPYLKPKKIIISPSKTRKLRLHSQRLLHQSRSSKRLKQQTPIALPTKAIPELKSNIRSLFLQQFLPLSFLTTLFDSVESLDLKQQQKFLSKTLNELLSNTNSLQVATKAVQDREELLLQMIKPSGVLTNKADCIEILTKYAVASILVIECIENWKSSLPSSHKRVNYVYNGQNYLIKMINDSKKLRKSQFSVIIGKIALEGFIPKVLGSEFDGRLRMCERKIIEEYNLSAKQVIFPGKRKSESIGLDLNTSEKLLQDIEKLDRNTKIFKRKFEGIDQSVKKNYFQRRDLRADFKNEETKGMETRKDNKSRNLAEIRLENHGYKTTVESINLTSRSKSNDRSTDEKLYLESIQGDIITQINSYTNDLPKAILDCLGSPMRAYTHSLSLKFPAFLWIKSSGSIVGLLILSLETQKTMQKRLFISHISSTSLSSLESIINLSVSYIISQYSCDEIRVALSSPANSEGKYESDKSIKQYFDKLNFKWKILIKDSEECPLHILGLRCDPKVSSENSEIFKDSINLKYYCLTQCGQKSNEQTSLISALGVASVLKRGGISISENAMISSVLSKVSDTWIPPAFKLKQDLTSDQAAEYIKGLKLPIPAVPLLCDLGLNSIELNWPRFLTSTINQHKYIYICGTQINIMRSKANKVYIIPTEDQNFSVFVVPCNEFKGSSLEKAKKILSELKAVDKVINELWLPEFSVRATSKINSEGNIFCEESLELEIKAATHSKGNLVLTPKANEEIIPQKFLFGIIHSKVDEDLEIPYIAVFVNLSQ